MNLPENNPKIVVITGAESTGKSVLTSQLASYFRCPFFKEYARDYIGSLNRPYNFSDVEQIAAEQVKQYEAARKLNAVYVFFDTWLIITKVWFEVVYNRKPDWLDLYIHNAEIALFLVCDTDLDWIPDPLRENGGEMRKKLQQTYLNNLEEFGFNYSVVDGTGESRFMRALNIMNNNPALRI
jgi:NadR type nicotinamide-nucleotide adenylyltransferase